MYVGRLFAKIITDRRFCICKDFVDSEKTLDGHSLGTLTTGGCDRRRALGDRHPHHPGQEAPPAAGHGGGGPQGGHSQVMIAASVSAANSQEISI